MPLAVQFGAGNIGRGFMGQLFFEAGYEIVFVDVDRKLVRALNQHAGYPLKLLDAREKREIDLHINGVGAVDAADEREAADLFAKADTAATAVGMANLPAVAPLIARGIEERRRRERGPIDVYLCENMLHAARDLKRLVTDTLHTDARRWAEESVGFVGTSVARMVPVRGGRYPDSGPLLVVADSYHQLAYDGSARKAAQPPIEGMHPVGNFRAEVERKLFMYNLGHAALAYLGDLKGYLYVHEPFGDGDLQPIFEGALEETSAALLKKYPEDFDESGQREVLRDIHLRFSNHLIQDTVRRVGRDPVRKLGPEDRLVGSARLCMEQGVRAEQIAAVCAAALCYEDPQDTQAVRLRGMVESRGPGETLRELSKIDPRSGFGEVIVSYYQEFQRRQEEWTKR
jgi:mannitol-1-phosphate 5-dehydrogenase